MNDAWPQVLADPHRDEWRHVVDDARMHGTKVERSKQAVGHERQGKLRPGITVERVHPRATANLTRSWTGIGQTSCASRGDLRGEASRDVDRVGPASARRATSLRMAVTLPVEWQANICYVSVCSWIRAWAPLKRTSYWRVTRLPQRVSWARRGTVNAVGKNESTGGIEVKYSNPKRRLSSPISAVDLFCGAGGLTHGLLQAGIRVEAGIDVDPAAAYAYSVNNEGAAFLEWDVGHKKPSTIAKLFTKRKYRLLAGCAPCQPFSKLTNGIARHRSWDLLDNFARFVDGIEPELVTMENVPELAQRGRAVFQNFVRTLKRCGYHVDWKIVNCTDYGVPQSRKRLVLLASRLGPIAVPDGRYSAPNRWRTVRQTISHLPSIAAGTTHPADPLHVAALLSPQNLKRIRATPHDGGTKMDWPKQLVLECHRRASGARYHSIYGRMWWDKPAPTMTTLCNGIGNGRFGHPVQDRAISLREAALLQSFPRGYEFWPRDERSNCKAIARMIGNAVPPALARVLGKALLDHVHGHAVRPRPVP